MAIQRDGEKCVICKLSRVDHKIKYGRDITVDHIDGKGRYSKIQNNTLENLQTLCLSCHGRKDNPKKLRAKDVLFIRRNINKFTKKELAEKFNVSIQAIKDVYYFNTWNLTPIALKLSL